MKKRYPSLIQVRSYSFLVIYCVNNCLIQVIMFSFLRICDTFKDIIVTDGNDINSFGKKIFRNFQNNILTLKLSFNCFPYHMVLFTFFKNFSLFCKNFIIFYNVVPLIFLFASNFGWKYCRKSPRSQLWFC